MYSKSIQRTGQTGNAPIGIESIHRFTLAWISHGHLLPLWPKLPMYYRKLAKLTLVCELDVKGGQRNYVIFKNKYEL